MLFKNIALALGACLVTLGQARDISVIGDLTDLQVQQMVDAYYNGDYGDEYDPADGELSAVGLMNDSSSDPFGMCEPASARMLFRRAEPVCDNNGSPNPDTNFLKRNRDRLATAAGYLAGSVPTGIFVYIQQARCQNNRACTVILSVVGYQSASYGSYEITMLVKNSIDDIRIDCDSHKGNESGSQPTANVRIATSSNANANCGGRSNCRMVRAA